VKARKIQALMNTGFGGELGLHNLPRITCQPLIGEMVSIVDHLICPTSKDHPILMLP